MNQNRKAAAINSGSMKTLFDGQSSKTFSNLDYKSEFEPLQQIIERIPLGASSAELIECYDCKRNAPLDGYRFQSVPLCKCCRTERELQITRNRFERREKR